MRAHQTTVLVWDVPTAAVAGKPFNPITGPWDVDNDGDGTPDCNDQCTADPNKTVPGACGCGVADTDSDGVPDDVDQCKDEAEVRRDDFHVDAAVGRCHGERPEDRIAPGVGQEPDHGCQPRNARAGANQWP